MTNCTTIALLRVRGSYFKMFVIYYPETTQYRVKLYNLNSVFLKPIKDQFICLLNKCELLAEGPWGNTTLVCSILHWNKRQWRIDKAARQSLLDYHNIQNHNSAILNENNLKIRQTWKIYSNTILNSYISKI